ncbi:MAG: DUF4003 family protein [Spirochaetaceae bacterium]|nr:DUF4003 family protein [Spirochaetaceae bacterium]
MRTAPRRRTALVVAQSVRQQALSGSSAHRDRRSSCAQDLQGPRYRCDRTSAQEGSVARGYRSDTPARPGLCCRPWAHPTTRVASYLRTFEELRARKRWSTQSVTFRFVALSLGAAASTIGYERLEEAATDLRKRARWSSPLKSEIRYVVAAMILRRGLDTARIHECVFATRDAIKAHKVPSRGTGPTLAALLMALHGEGAPVPEEHLERLAVIYRRWRTEHRWLTNANDLPAAALHASRDVPVDDLASDIERAYMSVPGENSPEVPK